MKRIILLSLIVLGNVVRADAQGGIFSTSCKTHAVNLTQVADCSQNTYTLVFEDNFTTSTLDDSKWVLPFQGVGHDFGHSSEKEWYVNTERIPSIPSVPISNNIEVSGGTLKIIARKETTPIVGTYVTDWTTTPETTVTENFEYTSALIQTKTKFGYGKYEARCKLPDEKGLWPAFWTYGEDSRWNEIDIFDNIDGGNEFSCGPGYDFDGDKEAEGCRYSETMNTTHNNMNLTDWHIYTCEYTPYKMTFYIDNIVYHTVYRYVTFPNGTPILCGDNPPIGFLCYESQYFPREHMNIIFNLAVKPDNTTTSPSSLEVDYVRFYSKGETNPPSICEGCIPQIEYTNTDKLPPITRTKNTIKTSGDVKILSSQSVTFKSPIITLGGSFKAKAGATFKAVAEECNADNFESSTINLIGDNLYNHESLDKCFETIYKVEVYGITAYNFQVYSIANGKNPKALVASVSGNPISNILNLWNVTNVADGWYIAELEFYNCEFYKKVKPYNIYIGHSNCRLINPNIKDSVDNTTIALKPPIDSVTIPICNIYPNPATNELNVQLASNLSTNIHLSINDSKGNIYLAIPIVRHNNVEHIDISDLKSGVYMVNITSNEGVFNSKLIILK